VAFHESHSNSAVNSNLCFQLVYGRKASRVGIQGGSCKSCSFFWWTALELSKKEEEKLGPQAFLLEAWCLLGSAHVGVSLTHIAKLKRDLIPVKAERERKARFYLLAYRFINDSV